MNERIKELMRQADYPAPELALRAHKLSELLIKDCTKIVEQYSMMKVEPVMLASIIRKTYGVE
jgi:hypothetical protein